MSWKYWGVFSELDNGFSLDCVWPSREQAVESASYSSGPVRVWPVEVSGIPRSNMPTPAEWTQD